MIISNALVKSDFCILLENWGFLMQIFHFFDSYSQMSPFGKYTVFITKMVYYLGLNVCDLNFLNLNFTDTVPFKCFQINQKFKFNKFSSQVQNLIQ